MLRPELQIPITHTQILLTKIIVEDEEFEDIVFIGLGC